MDATAHYPRTIGRDLPGLVSISPAPCRMILVEVFWDDKTDEHFVSWDDVIGVAAVLKTAYEKRGAFESDIWKHHGTHKELVDAGWRPTGEPEICLRPLILGPSPYGEDLWILDPDDLASNLKYHSILACDWPRSEDEKHAIERAQKLIKTDGEYGGRWAAVPREPTEPEPNQGE
jgi:hypothetical protein